MINIATEYSWRYLWSTYKTVLTGVPTAATLANPETVMADKYRNFAELARNEVSGVDYRILVRRGMAAFAIVAPHGGGIEPGTSEITLAVAVEDFSYYSFE